jgi:hypothetical protein
VQPGLGFHAGAIWLPPDGARGNRLIGQPRAVPASLPAGEAFARGERPMPMRALPCLWTAVLLLATLPAGARAGEAACVIATREADPLADRTQLLAQYEALPRHCLETVFRHCTAVANRTLLDLGTAAMCSIGYEALLRQGFGGDFHALMTWWRDGQPQALRR